MRLALAGLVAATLALAAPAAQAAFAPRLGATLDPAAPGADAALTTTITQASGETATKSLVVELPVGFRLGVPAKVTPCTPQQQDAGSCPPASEVGTASAATSLGSLSGPIQLAGGSGRLELIVHLRGFGGLVSQSFSGDLTMAAGRIQAGFADMPNTPTTSLALAFAGGDRALFTVTSTCGPALFDASFTSQQDEQATSQASVDVEGCASTSPPVISAVGVKPRVFRVVRKFADTRRAGYGTTLTYTLSEATNGTRVSVERRIGRNWRRAGSFVAGGDDGPNQVRWDGRLRGRPLRPGRYRFSLVTTSRGGVRSKPYRVRFRIRS